MPSDGSESRLSNTPFGEEQKKLMTLVNDLSSMGAQAELDLPSIAVIGNQSAGKSSIVESISAIKVPRDAGTCTRTPCVIRLKSSAEPWSCRISLRREFNEQGARLNDITEIPFGTLITDPDDLEQMLRRAQSVLLNPTIPTDEILSATPEVLNKGLFKGYPKQRKFSRNSICLNISGPEVTDLSFVDLPGLIQNEDHEVVSLVEDLVMSHIKKENCLILVALPMTDDLENQKALRLARTVDPEGRRTIGVLTKPDVLGKGATKMRESYLDVVEGRSHPLRLGYYMTRQPDDDERSRKIAFSEMRDAEAKFFAETSPWSTCILKERFGIPNLVAALSGLLIQLMNDTLPSLQAESLRCLELCQSQLEQLPPATEIAPTAQLMDLVVGFCTDIKRIVKGAPDTVTLIHQNRDAYHAFRQSILNTAPRFQPYVAGNMGIPSFEFGKPSSGSGKQPANPAEDLIAEMKDVYLDDVHRSLAMSVTRELPGNIPYEAKVKLIQAYQTAWKRHVHSCFDAVRANMRSTLDEFIKSHFGRYLRLASQMRSHANELANQCADTCLASLLAIVSSEMVPYTLNTVDLKSNSDHWLSIYQGVRSGKPGLESLYGFHSPSKKAQTGSTEASFTFGGPKPVHNDETTPVGGLSAFKFDSPQSQGRSAASTPGTPSKSDFAPKPIIPINKHSSNITVSQQPLEKAPGADAPKPLSDTAISVPDPYETELRTMAEVRGYFDVSHKRFIDIITMLIDGLFVQGVASAMQHHIIRKLDFGSTDTSARFARYLAEEPSIVNRREELMSRQRRLQGVLAQLDDFGI